jgi:hypothetical protein
MPSLVRERITGQQLEIFKAYPIDCITRRFLDGSGEVKEKYEARLKKLILQTFLVLKDEQHPKSEGEEFMLGAKVVGMATDKMNEIIDARFPKSVGYILLDMVEYFCDPREAIINTSLGDGKLQKGKFNEAKVERYYNLKSGARKSAKKWPKSGQTGRFGACGDESIGSE